MNSNKSVTNYYYYYYYYYYGVTLQNLSIDVSYFSTEDWPTLCHATNLSSQIKLYV